MMGAMKTIRAWAAASAAALLFAVGAWGQDLERSAAPVELKIKPPLAAAGSAVRLWGKSLRLNESLKYVGLAVKKPSGGTIQAKAEVGSDNLWFYDFKDTAAEGNYEVTATGPDGKGTAKGSFRVLRPGALSGEATEALGKSLLKLRDGADRLGPVVAALPASPAREELAARLETLSSRLAEAPAQAKALKDALAPVDKLVEQHPEFAEPLSPYYQSLGEAADRAGEGADRFLEKVAAGEKKTQLCDDLDTVNEALSFLSLQLDLLGNLFQKALNVLLDKVLPDKMMQSLPVSQRDPNLKFAVGESLKLAVTVCSGGPISWLTSLVGYAADCAQFAVSALFSKYCERFTGTFKAVFDEEHYFQGTTWWKSRVVLEGKVNLRYAKGVAGAVAVHGEFDGNPASFTCEDDLTALMPVMRRNLVFHKTFPPTGVGYSETLGRYGRALVSPYHFYVPVTGSLQGNTLTLEIGESTQDYKDKAKAEALYILVEPALPIPYCSISRLPYQGGGFILSRGMRAKPQFTVVSDKAAGVSRIQQTFTRQEKGPKDDFLVKWKVDVTACNPECP